VNPARGRRSPRGVSAAGARGWAVGEVPARVEGGFAKGGGGGRGEAEGGLKEMRAVKQVGGGGAEEGGGEGEREREREREGGREDWVL